MIRFAENLNKMIAAGLGGALEAPRTEVAVGHRVIYTEVSGAVASFETNVIAPVKNLRVTMDPFQDLHGYDHPWPAGGGKNLLDIPDSEPRTEKGVTWSFENGLLHINGTGTEGQVLFAIETSLPSDTYTFSVQIISGSMSGSNSSFNGYTADNIRAWVVAFGKSGASVSGTYTNNIARIYCYCNTGSVFDNAVIGFQVERGSSMSTWMPYSNICPITGRDAVAVYRSGADMSDPQSVTVQLGQTVYGGSLDVTSGVTTVEWANIASYDGEALPGEWISDRDVYAPGAVPTIGAQVVYKREIADMIILTPAQLSTLAGENNVWSDAGDISLEYPYYEETEGY